MYLHPFSLEIAHHRHREAIALARKDHLVAEALSGRPRRSWANAFRRSLSTIVVGHAAVPAMLMRQRLRCRPSGIR